MDKKFKYQTGDVLYYVNPFIFNIDIVRVDFCYIEDDGTPYYIEQTGAYLREWELFKTLEEAKEDALKKLDKFHCEKIREINNSKGIFNEDLL